jgi:hypothetical protein
MYHKKINPLPTAHHPTLCHKKKTEGTRPTHLPRILIATTIIIIIVNYPTGTHPQLKRVSVDKKGPKKGEEIYGLSGEGIWI